MSMCPWLCFYMDVQGPNGTRVVSSSIDPYISIYVLLKNIPVFSFLNYCQRQNETNIIVYNHSLMNTLLYLKRTQMSVWTCISIWPPKVLITSFGRFTGSQINTHPSPGPKCCLLTRLDILFYWETGHITVVWISVCLSVIEGGLGGCRESWSS